MYMILFIYLIPIANPNLNTLKINYANMLGSSNKALMLITEHYDHWAERMEDYLTDLDEDLWRSGTDGPLMTFMADLFLTSTL